MKNAMICPNELVYDYTNQLVGWRVAQVESDTEIFSVANPLFWTVCADNVVADQFYYDSTTTQIVPKPVTPIPANQSISSGTQTL